MKIKPQQDVRFNLKSISWKDFFITYFVLSTLTAGQAMIYDAYNPAGANVPTPYILGMMGYWFIVSFIYCLITSYQKHRHFGKPLHRLSESAKQVAEGDFSIYLEPVHRAGKRDYIDAMFEDFNKMVEELGSIETLKNDFISNVSHEIRTPLSVIQSYAMALQKDELAPELRKDYSETIIAASRKLTTLVMNILKLNKLENQEISHAAAPYDLCRQLADSIIYFENAWEDKTIGLVVDIEERAVIHADESMLEIVWHNLLSNAVKFTPPGGTIALTQTSDEDTVTVSVSDSGCGMDELTLKRIFDKFYQGDTSHSGEGNGLGLALSLRVIELAGGAISVTSEPGQGATFTVSLNKEP